MSFIFSDESSDGKAGVSDRTMRLATSFVIAMGIATSLEVGLCLYNAPSGTHAGSSMLQDGQLTQPCFPHQRDNKREMRSRSPI
jgi:hypothetical protein